MAEGPVFGAFVRSVEGHAVPRYGTTEYLGAVRVLGGIQWDCDRIIPLTDDYCRRYARELNQHFESGELRKCTAEEWKSYQAELDKQAKLASQQAQASEGTTIEEPKK